MSLEQGYNFWSSQIGEPVIGEWYEMTQDRIDKFAEATGDYQWIHMDPDRAAKESPYGSTIAHGYLTISLIPFLSGELASGYKPPVDGVKQYVNYGSNKVRLMNAIRPGDRIRSNYHIIKIEKMRRTALRIVKEVTIEIEGARKPACVAETVALLFF